MGRFVHGAEEVSAGSSVCPSIFSRNSLVANDSFSAGPATCCPAYGPASPSVELHSRSCCRSDSASGPLLSSYLVSHQRCWPSCTSSLGLSMPVRSASLLPHANPLPFLPSLSSRLFFPPPLISFAHPYTVAMALVGAFLGPVTPRVLSAVGARVPPSLKGSVIGLTSTSSPALSLSSSLSPGLTAFLYSRNRTHRQFRRTSPLRSRRWSRRSLDSACGSHRRLPLLGRWVVRDAKEQAEGGLRSGGKVLCCICGKKRVYRWIVNLFSVLSSLLVN